MERLQAALQALAEDGPEAILDLVDPHVEWIADRSDTGPVTYRGPEGVKKSFEELSEGFEAYGFKADRFIDAGSQVVAVGCMYGVGRTTGITAEIPLGIVFTIGRNGKLVRYESFRDPEEALEAAGLKE